ncbi:hypothetical protein [Paenibacillus sp. SAFN-117]|uniref:hypothetical protein n=1 Tax=Paenibacillus sp. SAFN-117 TaxID=3436860 RepID=UPI003F7EBACD
MVVRWKKTLSAVVLTASLLSSGYSAYAAGDLPAAAEQTSAVYSLTEALSVEVKSVLNERNDTGSRIGIVVKMENNSGRNARVPDYEVRVRTSDGLQYTLQPSATNARTVQPKEKIELSYMTSVDRTGFNVSEISWVDIDMYVYPKVETEMLTVPVQQLEWTGSGDEINRQGAVLKWGESFTIPSLTSPLRYTPSKVEEENTPTGPVKLITLLVENPGTTMETVPDFMLEGKSGKSVFKGQRAETEPITLEPGEREYIHYAIPVKNNVDLESFNLLTQENFMVADPTGKLTPIPYEIGRLNVVLPGKTGFSLHGLNRYVMDTPMKVDDVNSLIHPDVDVSLVELYMHENQGEGYKTAIAKFKLRNKGEQPVPVPVFDVDLKNSGGYTYSGVRQISSTEKLMPNLSYTVSYSFAIPESENEEKLGLFLVDSQTAKPYRTTISAYQTEIMKQDETSSRLSFYPFDVELKDWTLLTSTNPMPGYVTYSYKLQLDLDIQRKDRVVLDQSFSTMKVELIDTLGRTIAQEHFSFTGMNRLISGVQTVEFKDLRTDQYEYPLTIRIYEAIETPQGEAKRLVKTLKQH